MGVDYLINCSGIFGYPFWGNKVESLSYTICKNKFYIKGLNKKFYSKCKRIYIHSWSERDLNHDCKSTKRFICMKPNF